jgi:NADH-quinone oxidoreductase subunit F
VIIAVGQAPDVSFLDRDSRLERALWGALEVDENSLRTNVPGIFAGGDFTTGPTYVIRAIASGRRAALAIHRFLRGEEGRVRIVDEKTALEQESALALEEETVEGQPRIPVRTVRPEERVVDFREVEQGFSEEQAQREAARCLRCDLEKERSEA